MRIISGSHKGRRLTAPKNLPVRPTTDFAKEGLFNILRNRHDFQELSVLDLFAGTGNISFEFASRGVPGITAVDAHVGCIRYIQKITTEFDFPITSLKMDVFSYLSKPGNSYDVIFADPPYDMPTEGWERLVELIFENDWLAEEGLLIVEHAKQRDLSQHPFFLEQRNYGGSVFSFFGKE